MASSITLYDSLGNPQVVTGDTLKEIIGIDNRQLATAWARIGADGTIISSYNVSSVVKAATGVYNVYFDVPITEQNPSISILPVSNSAKISTSGALVSGNYVVARLYGSTGTALDNEFSIIIFGGNV